MQQPHGSWQSGQSGARHHAVQESLRQRLLLARSAASAASLLAQACGKQGLSMGRLIQQLRLVDIVLR